MEQDTAEALALELPALVLQVVAAHLPRRDVAECRLVCRQWRGVFAGAVRHISVQVDPSPAAAVRLAAAAASCFPSAAAATLLLPNASLAPCNVYDSAGAAMARVALSRTSKKRVEALAAERHRRDHHQQQHDDHNSQPQPQSQTQQHVIPGGGGPTAGSAHDAPSPDRPPGESSDSMSAACAAAAAALAAALPRLASIQLGDALRPRPTPAPSAAIGEAAPSTLSTPSGAHSILPHPPPSWTRPHPRPHAHPTSPRASPHQDPSVLQVDLTTPPMPRAFPDAATHAAAPGAYSSSAWAFPASLVPPEGAACWPPHASEARQHLAQQAIASAHAAPLNPSALFRALPSLTSLDARVALDTWHITACTATGPGGTPDPASIPRISHLTVLQLRDGGCLVDLCEPPLIHNLRSLDLWCQEGRSLTDLAYWTSAAPQRVRRALPALGALSALTRLALRELGAQVEPPPPLGVLAAGLPVLRHLTLELVYSGVWGQLEALMDELEGGSEGEDSEVWEEGSEEEGEDEDSEEWEERSEEEEEDDDDDEEEEGEQEGGEESEEEGAWRSGEAEGARGAGGLQGGPAVGSSSSGAGRGPATGAAAATAAHEAAPGKAATPAAAAMLGGGGRAGGDTPQQALDLEAEWNALMAWGRGALGPARAGTIGRVVRWGCSVLGEMAPLDLFSCFAGTDELPAPPPLQGAAAAGTAAAAAAAAGDAAHGARDEDGNPGGHVGVVGARGLTHLDVSFVGCGLLPGAWAGLRRLGSLTSLRLRVERCSEEERLVAGLVALQRPMHRASGEGDGGGWSPDAFEVDSLTEPPPAATATLLTSRGGGGGWPDGLTALRRLRLDCPVAPLLAAALRDAALAPVQMAGAAAAAAAAGDGGGGGPAEGHAPAVAGSSGVSSGSVSCPVLPRALTHLELRRVAWATEGAGTNGGASGSSSEPSAAAPAAQPTRHASDPSPAGPRPPTVLSYASVLAVLHLEADLSYMSYLGEGLGRLVCLRELRLVHLAGADLGVGAGQGALVQAVATGSSRAGGTSSGTTDAMGGGYRHHQDPVQLQWGQLPASLECLHLEAVWVGVGAAAGVAAAAHMGDGDAGAGSGALALLPLSRLESLSLRRCCAGLRGLAGARLLEVEVDCCWLHAGAGDSSSRCSAHGLSHLPAAAMQRAGRDEAEAEGSTAAADLPLSHVAPPWDAVAQLQAVCCQPWAGRLRRLGIKLGGEGGGQGAGDAAGAWPGSSLGKRGAGLGRDGERCHGDAEEGAAAIAAAAGALCRLEHLGVTWGLASLAGVGSRGTREGAVRAGLSPREAEALVGAVPPLRSLELHVGEGEGVGREEQGRDVRSGDARGGAEGDGGAGGRAVGCGLQLGQLLWLLRLRSLRRLKVVLCTGGRTGADVTGRREGGAGEDGGSTGGAYPESRRGLHALEGQEGSSGAGHGGWRMGAMVSWLRSSLSAAVASGTQPAADPAAPATSPAGPSSAPGPGPTSAWLHAELSALLLSALPHCQSQVVQVRLE